MQIMCIRLLDLIDIFVDPATHLFDFNFCSLFDEEIDYFSGRLFQYVGWTDCISVVELTIFQGASYYLQIDSWI